MLGIGEKRYLRRPGRYEAVLVDVALFPYNLFRVPAMLTSSPHVVSLSENKVYRKYFPI